MASNNTFRTMFLLTALTVILLLFGRVFGGTQGMIFAFIFALAMNFTSYWFSDKIALAMAGAHEVSESEAPELHSIVNNLAMYARLPKPRVYVINSDSPNAFATGRDPSHAAVAVTQGLLGMLNRTELEAVLSHEMGHVRNRDTLTMTVTATIAGAITMLAHMAQWALMFGGLGGRNDEEGGGIADVAAGLLMIILAPIAATIIQLAISRAREFEADATGARISGQPLALADALEKLEAGTRYRPMQVPPATAHLFIVNPLGNNGWVNLFRTHPTTEERVARLHAMAFAIR
ncbi:MAG TPA: zinc metalloprotease HtpX [Chloroflexota bacterium]|nr:zinc metalloprotease HtpX [Chloroflexota bacterium]